MPEPCTTNDAEGTSADAKNVERHDACLCSRFTSVCGRSGSGPAARELMPIEDDAEVLAEHVKRGAEFDEHPEANTIAKTLARGSISANSVAGEPSILKVNISFKYDRQSDVHGCGGGPPALLLPFGALRRMRASCAHQSHLGPAAHERRLLVSKWLGSP